MKPDEDNASMDSILASIRRIIASEPDPMPESMEDEKGAMLSRTKSSVAPVEDTPSEKRGSILELKTIVENRQTKDEQPQTRPVDAEGVASKTLEIESASEPEPDTAAQDPQEDALGKGFEVFLRSTLERIVMDFLKNWADQNIPRLAERILREEIKNTFDQGSAPKRRVS